jgi:hypothetical protein
MSVGLMASQLRFGSFLMDNFGEELIAGRRARERQAAYLDERDPSGSSVRRKKETETSQAGGDPSPADAGGGPPTDAQDQTGGTGTGVPDIHSLDTAKRPSVPPTSSRAPIYAAVVIVLVSIAVAAALVLR